MSKSSVGLRYKFPRVWSILNIRYLYRYYHSGTKYLDVWIRGVRFFSIKLVDFKAVLLVLKRIIKNV